MRMCQKHWDALRRAIRDRGMEHLVAPSHDALMEKLDRREYEPLYVCNIMILERALVIGGDYLLEGDYCPVCEALHHTAEDATVTPGDVERAWIDAPADVALSYCTRNGLLPGSGSLH